MDLIPILASLSVGVPWVDNTLRIIGTIYVLYSVFLNILVAAYPEAAKWRWVVVSLAVVANIQGLLSKVVKGEPTIATPPPPDDLRTYLKVVQEPRKPISDLPTSNRGGKGES